MNGFEAFSREEKTMLPHYWDHNRFVISPAELPPWLRPQPPVLSTLAAPLGLAPGLLTAPPLLPRGEAQWPSAGEGSFADVHSQPAIEGPGNGLSPGRFMPGWAGMAASMVPGPLGLLGTGAGMMNSALGGVAELQKMDAIMGVTGQAQGLGSRIGGFLSGATGWQLGDYSRGLGGYGEPGQGGYIGMMNALDPGVQGPARARAAQMVNEMFGAARAPATPSHDPRIPAGWSPADFYISMTNPYEVVDSWNRAYPGNQIPDPRQPSAPPGGTVDSGGGGSGGYGGWGDNAAGAGKGTEWRKGGPIPNRGSSRSEPVKITAHEGEYVIRASIVEALGQPLLDAINMGLVGRRELEALLDP